MAEEDRRVQEKLATGELFQGMRLEMAEVHSREW